MTYPVLTQAGTLSKPLNHFIQLSLEQSFSLASRFRIGRQSQDPLLHRSPDIGNRFAGGGLGHDGIVMTVATARAVAGERRVGDAGHSGVPLGQSSCDGPEDGRIGEVVGLSHGAWNEAVKHAIAKASEELGSQVVLHEKLVICRFPFSVNQDVGSVSVGTQEDGITIHVGLAEARTAIDSLEQSVGDAVGETNEIDVGLVRRPVREQRCDELHGRVLRVIVVVAQGNEANMARRVTGNCGSSRRHDDGDLRAPRSKRKKRRQMEATGRGESVSDRDEGRGTKKKEIYDGKKKRLVATSIALNRGFRQSNCVSTE